MGTHGVHMKKAIPWLVRWARSADTRDFVLPWKLWSASTKYFFLAANYFTLFVSIAQQPGQAVVPGFVSLNMSF
jgi:hypothetical protein